jgi:t-SNARE complex subunit (syntaxin)
MFSLSLQRLNK